MQVAVDVTPLLGPRSGVGQTVRGLLDALPPDVTVARWELTRRSVTIPPRVLVRLWSRFDRPGGDRWLPAADVVHGTNFVVPPTSRPSTVTVHDTWCAAGGDCDPTIAAATATVQRAVDRGAWLHVSTEWVAGEVRRLYGADRVRVVPFGVPEVGEAGPSPIDEPYVLALGGGPRKGIDVLRQAMADLADLADVRLVVTGAGGELGWVDDATRAALLRGASVLAYPSLDEGFGFPVLEAMSVGVPVVASAVGGVPEVAGDAALLVPAGDPAALASALRTALGDETERQRLVTAGRSRASSFSWDAHARGMVQLWHDALEAA